jgi:hypothetical protein
MNWNWVGDILITVGIALVLLPFVSYLLGKCIMFGILTAKQQFKEYENGKSKKKE